MPTGKVKWFNADKGFGFLAEDGGEDVFVHRDALPSGVTELKPGQRVEFGVVQGRKGNQALSVRRAEAVFSYLVNRGVDPERFRVEGFGKSQPIASNATEAGRAQNRRVELVPVP